MKKSLILFLLKGFYPIFSKVLPFSAYAYLATGAVNTFLNIGLFLLFFKISMFSVSTAFLSVEIATVLSFLITVLSGFWMNKNFAFSEASRASKQVQKQFKRYFLVAFQGQFSDYFITKGLILFIYIRPEFAYFMSTIIMLIINYFLQKYYTFKIYKGSLE